MRCLFYIAYFTLYFNTLRLYCQIKQTQDEEKKQLTALRDLIKSSLQLDQKEVGTSPEDIYTPPLSKMVVWELFVFDLLITESNLS